MSKKPSLRLSSSLTLRALHTAALRAAVLAEARRKMPRPQPQLPHIEMAMRAVRANAQVLHGRGLVAVYEKPQRFSSAHAILAYYPEAAYKRYIEESKSADPRVRNKSRKPLPASLYVFYPAAEDATRLGSVAIYGDDARQQGADAQRSGTIFTLPVSSVSYGVGLHPFTDVKIRS